MRVVSMVFGICDVVRRVYGSECPPLRWLGSLAAAVVGVLL